MKQLLYIAVEDSLQPLLKEFRDKGRVISPTFCFWDESMCKVFISSASHGSWEVHLSAKYLFAAYHTNYSRYMPVIMLLMKPIPAEVLYQLQDGQFVAKLSDGKFNGVWPDYTLETTGNKALNGTGGIIGLMLKAQALAQQFLCRSITAQYAMQYCRNTMPQTQNVPGFHHAGKAARKQWDDDVGAAIRNATIHF
jgi:hypothetical protein